MLMRIRTGLMVYSGICIALLILACPVPENEITEKPVGSIEILKNGAVILDLTGTGYPFITIFEEKSVILSAKLDPDVHAGIHWQSTRNIVDLSQLSGPEIVLFARYGGETNIIIRAQNSYNQAPIYGVVKITVIPTSWFKWDYRLDGWKDQSALKSFELGRIYNMLTRTGNAPIHEDPVRGGLVMEGPATLVIGSVMPSPTNSVYGEDPLFDDGALLNFTRIPSDKNPPASFQPYSLKVKIEAEYEILSDPAPRQGLRLQVNNNTEERDNASVFVNWLVAEYTSASPRTGILSGVFDTAAAAFDPLLDPDKKDRIPEMIRWQSSTSPDNAAEDKEARQLHAVLSHSFVCLSLPDGKVLIRNIRIESVQGQISD